MEEKIILSSEERALPASEIAAKYKVARATAWRAKKKGWLCPAYRTTKNVRGGRQRGVALAPLNEKPPPGARIELSAEEKALGVTKLRTRYRVGTRAARAALESGILVMPQRGQLHRSRLAPVKRDPAKCQAPEARDFRVYLSDEERVMPLPSLKKIISGRFPQVTRSMLEEGRRRGYFCPNHGRPAEVAINMDRAKDVGYEALHTSAARGVRSALRKLFGTSSEREVRPKIRPFSFEELVQEAEGGLLQLSGHKKFPHLPWRIVVAKNRTMGFLKREVFRHGRMKMSVDRFEGRYDR